MQDRPWRLRLNVRKGPIHRLSASIPQAEMLANSFCDIAAIAMQNAKDSHQKRPGPRPLGAAQAATKAANEARFTAERALADQDPTPEEARTLSDHTLPLALEITQDAAHLMSRIEMRHNSNNQVPRHGKATLHSATAAVLHQLLGQHQPPDSDEWVQTLQTAQQLASFILHLDDLIPGANIPQTRTLITAFAALNQAATRFKERTPTEISPAVRDAKQVTATIDTLPISLIGCTPGIWIAADPAGTPIPSTLLVWMSHYHNRTYHVRALEDPQAQGLPVHLARQYAADMEILLQSTSHDPYITPEITRGIQAQILAEQKRVEADIRPDTQAGTGS